MVASSDLGTASAVRTAFQDSLISLSRGSQGIDDLFQSSRAWDLATAFLHPRKLDGLSWSSGDHGGILAAFRWLADAEMTGELLKHFYRSVDERFYLVEDDVATAVAQLEASKDSDDGEFGHVSGQLFERLLAWQQAWAVPLAAFEDSSVRPRFNDYFVQTLHLRLPSNYPDLMHRFFARSFAAHAAAQPRDAPALHPFESPAVPIMPLPSPLSGSVSIQALQRLLFLSRFAPEITSVAYRAIEHKVAEECAGEWEHHQLESLRQWGRDVIGTWWEHFHIGQDGLDHIMKPVLSRIDYHVNKTLSDLRTTELFDIIVSYPDTLPALNDLKECIAKVDSRTDVVNALQASNVKRLLHPGADTKDIMMQYVSTIRCLRIVDPPGVLLHRVSEPIRRFLKKRPDTIRCIVASLIDDDDGELMGDDEGGIKPLDERDDTFDDYSDPHWMPEPVDAAPEFRSGKASDIVSTLVSIYESRDVIVKELQVLLAQKLLAVRNYDLEREIRTIEILKLRFGEAALQVCEVMLKDLADSKRINQRIQTTASSVLQPKIISRHFWPTFPASALVLPGQLQAATNAYAQAYHQIKPDKHLRWLSGLGTVEVTLELADRTIEAEVTPLQAAVVELFGQQAIWDVKRLSAILSVRDTTAVLSAVNFWANQGVVKSNRSDGTWTVLEHRDDGPVDVEMRAGIAQDANADQDSTEADQVEQMRPFWQFIQSMLSSLGSLPTDRIQQTLGFAPGYDRTLEQLGAFLEALRLEGVMERSGGGEWSLTRPS